MKNFYKIVFSLLLLFSFQNSFSQRAEIVNSFKINELGNNEMEIEVNASNIVNVSAITLRIKIDTNSLDFQNFTFENPSFASAIFNYDNSKSQIVMTWADVLPLNIGNVTFCKAKFNRLNCNSTIFWEFVEYGDSISDIINEVSFLNNIDDSCVVGINNIQTDPSVLTAVSFPNPNFGDKLAINYNANKNGNINAQLYNSQGKLVYKIENQKSESNGTLTFDLQNLAKGIYYYNVNLVNSDQTYRFTDKIVIE